MLIQFIDKIKYINFFQKRNDELIIQTNNNYKFELKILAKQFLSWRFS
jgi:hypothetical protein